MFLHRSHGPVAQAIKQDRLDYWNRLAEKAAIADESNDSATLFSVSKCVAPKPPPPLKTVLLKDGSLAKTPLQARLRWQEHFCSVLSADVTPIDTIASSNVKHQESALQ